MLFVVCLCGVVGRCLGLVGLWCCVGLLCVVVLSGFWVGWCGVGACWCGVFGWVCGGWVGGEGIVVWVGVGV